MNKAFGFITLLFITFVVFNWGFRELQSLTASYAILPSVPSAYARGIQAPAPPGKKAVPVPASKMMPQIKSTAIANVPFFSQFADIQSPQWQQVGCGITSLAMMIDFYKPNTVSVNNLLQQGVAAGAYDPNNGWNFGGLIQLAQQYGLAGNFIDLSKLKVTTALARLENYLNNGPLILAVHNKFNPNDSLPHLVVIDGIKNNIVYYNDPAAKIGKKTISVANLVRGWEKKGIVLRPAKNPTGGIGMSDVVVPGEGVEPS
jgi:uncharacterized protein YvpB